jgi:hypothetical protein
MWAGLITPPRRVSFLSAARQSGSFERFFVLLGVLRVSPLPRFSRLPGQGGEVFRVCCPHLPSAALDLVSPSRPPGGGTSTYLTGPPSNDL